MQYPGTASHKTLKVRHWPVPCNVRHWIWSGIPAQQPVRCGQSTSRSLDLLGPDKSTCSACVSEYPVQHPVSILLMAVINCLACRMLSP